MNIQNIEQRFNTEQIATIKQFMEFIIDSNKSPKTFSDITQSDKLQSDIGIETDEQINATVREWIAERKKKGHKV
jgi:hypothetical protein